MRTTQIAVQLFANHNYCASMKVCLLVGACWLVQIHPKPVSGLLGSVGALFKPRETEEKKMASVLRILFVVLTCFGLVGAAIFYFDSRYESKEALTDQQTTLTDVQVSVIASAQYLRERQFISFPTNEKKVILYFSLAVTSLIFFFVTEGVTSRRSRRYKKLSRFLLAEVNSLRTANEELDRQNRAYRLELMTLEVQHNALKDVLNANARGFARFYFDMS